MQFFLNIRKWSWKCYEWNHPFEMRIVFYGNPLVSTKGSTAHSISRSTESVRLQGIYSKCMVFQNHFFLINARAFMIANISRAITLRFVKTKTRNVWIDSNFVVQNSFILIFNSWEWEFFLYVHLWSLPALLHCVLDRVLTTLPSINSRGLQVKVFS